MKHEYSAPIMLSERGGQTAREVSFCLACGALRSTFTSRATGRASSLYAVPTKGGDTIAHANDPACAPAADSRTKVNARHVPTLAEPIAYGWIEQLGEPITRPEWRKLTDAAGLLHISRYRPIEQGRRSADLYGPFPTAWCGLALGLVSWTTIGLAGAPERYEPGDAICVTCWGKSAWTRKRDRARGPVLP